jgi:hypothetical protein
VNEHNRWIPRDFWLEELEKRAIGEFHASVSFRRSCALEER